VVNRLASLTVISTVNDLVADTSAFDRVTAVLTQYATEFDFVLVANAVDQESTLRLKDLINQIPDLTVVFLGDKVHDDVARLIGIEHAVNDYVLLFDMARDNPSVLPALLGPLDDRLDMAVGNPSGQNLPHHSYVYRVLFGVYSRIYAAMTGVELGRVWTGPRVLSREAALFILGRPNAEFLLRARDIGSGFVSRVIALPPAPSAPPSPPRRRHSLSSGIAMLLSVNAMPLRVSSYVALCGGLLSALYGVYVFAVYMLKSDVVEGWTTTSLQLAAMMFVFSLVLMFISEYVIQIHSASPPRSRRYLVVRELRSPLTRRSNRRNIVDAEGAYQLGKPGWAVSTPQDDR